MKEKIYTIPLNDAFKAGDECAFCFIERKLEEQTMDFVLGAGASYMEDDVRAETDEMGFCKVHYKKMYEYGNRLGAGLIMKTHFQKLCKDLDEAAGHFVPGKGFRRLPFKKMKAPSGAGEYQMAAWAKKVTGTCYICDHYRDAYGRYIETFFDMFRKNGEFKELFKNSKGFCIPHFADLAEAGERLLSDKDKKEFFEILIPMMQENLHRIYEDLDWFCDKFDYRNKDADWKTSKDALQRGMQKAGGGYPADPPYVMNR